MEIRNLITFLKVVELENFTRAAEKLGYVQSTVTMQIQQLEKKMGVPLFERIGKSVILTAAGRDLVEYARQIIQLTEQAVSIGKKSTDIRGVLRIGIIESLFTWQLSDLIPLYRKEFPCVSISINISSGRDLMIALGKNELDIIFILDQNISVQNMVRVLAKPENLVFVTYPEHPLCASTNLSLREIVASSLVLPERHGIYMRALENITLQKSLELRPIIETNNTSSIVKLLKNKLGISFLPEYVIQESVQAGELTILHTDDCEIAFWSQLFYHKNKWVSPAMQGFIELLKNNPETKLI